MGVYCSIQLMDRIQGSLLLPGSPVTYTLHSPPSAEVAGTCPLDDAYLVACMKALTWFTVIPSRGQGIPGVRGATAVAGLFCSLALSGCNNCYHVLLGETWAFGPLRFGTTTLARRVLWRDGK